MKSGASGDSVPAAPGDGRTPPRHSPAVTDPLPGSLFCRLPNPPGHAIVSSIYPNQINTIGLCLVLCGPAFAERQGTEIRGGINMPKSLPLEGNELNRDMLSRRSERKGCAVVCAVNGQGSIPKARPGRPGLSLRQSCGGKHLKPAP